MRKLTEAEASRVRQKLMAHVQLDDVGGAWNQQRHGTQRDEAAEREIARFGWAADHIIGESSRKEPKSIHAEVKSFSIPKPRRGAGRKPDGYQPSKVRHGKGMWITIART